MLRCRTYPPAWELRRCRRWLLPEVSDREAPHPGSEPGRRDPTRKPTLSVPSPRRGGRRPRKDGVHNLVLCLSVGPALLLRRPNPDAPENFLEITEPPSRPFWCARAGKTRRDLHDLLIPSTYPLKLNALSGAFATGDWKRSRGLRSRRTGVP